MKGNYNYYSLNYSTSQWWIFDDTTVKEIKMEQLEQTIKQEEDDQQQDEDTDTSKKKKKKKKQTETTPDS